jgi:hypothetical protein
LRANPLDFGKQEKYGVITHSSILKALTAEGVDNEGKLINPRNFKNCEAVPVHLD